MGAVPSVADLLTRVPSWSGREVSWRPLQGGLSHHIYLVEVDGRSCVLRVLNPAISVAGLGVEPKQEIENTLLAAESGAGPAVYEVLPDIPALIIEYLPGRTLAAADVRDAATIPAIAAACRRLHAGPPFANPFDIFDKRDELLGVCRRSGLRLPERYLERLVDAEHIRVALTAGPQLPGVPCHNDLLAENLIESGGRIRIIDYQLAGQNDPTFELGNIAAESDYDPDLVERLAGAYFGADVTPMLVARVRLHLIASNFTWALWFSVHSGLFSEGADATFDYAAEAADKWNQAQSALDDAGFGRLLDAVAGRCRR